MKWSLSNSSTLLTSKKRRVMSNGGPLLEDGRTIVDEKVAGIAVPSGVC